MCVSEEKTIGYFSAKSAERASFFHRNGGDTEMYDIPEGFVRNVNLPTGMIYTGAEAGGFRMGADRDGARVLSREDDFILFQPWTRQHGAIVNLWLQPAAMLTLSEALAANARHAQRIFMPRAVLLRPAIGEPIRIDNGQTFSLVDDRLIIRDPAGIETHNLPAAEYRLDWARE